MSLINIPSNVRGPGATDLSDPKLWAVTKTGSEIGADFYYFHTGDIAKLQGAILTLDTSGNWDSPDFKMGGTTVNPAFANQVLGLNGCLNSNGCLWGGFLPCDTVLGIPCFASVSDIEFYVENTMGIPPTFTSKSTQLLTVNKAITPAINEIIGQQSLVTDQKANFKYAIDSIDSFSDTFAGHLGPIYTSTDFARIKAKIRMVPTMMDGLSQGNLYSGLELLYDYHTGFVNEVLINSGYTVYTTGDQNTAINGISGLKTFLSEKTTIKNTGRIEVLHGGIANTLYPVENFDLGTPNMSSTVGGVQNSVYGPNSTIIGGGYNNIWCGNTGNLIAHGQNNEIGFNTPAWLCRLGQQVTNSTILNGGFNQIWTGSNHLITNSEDAFISGKQSNIIMGAPSDWPFPSCEIRGGRRSAIISSSSSQITNDGVINNGLSKSAATNQFSQGVILGSEESLITTEFEGGNSSIVSSRSSTIGGWTIGSVILGGDNNTIRTWGGFNNTIIGGNSNVITGDTRRLDPQNPHSSFAAGSYSKVSGHKGAFVLSDSINLPDKIDNGDDTISFYFKNGVYASGDLYQYVKPGGYSKVVTQIDLDAGLGDVLITGCLQISGTPACRPSYWDGSSYKNFLIDTYDFGNTNIAGDLNITGNTYISGGLWITGSDGKACQITSCAGGGVPAVKPGPGNTTQINNNLSISGDTHISGSLTVDKNVYFKSGLWVSGKSTFGDVDITGCLRISGNPACRPTFWNGTSYKKFLIDGESVYNFPSDVFISGNLTVSGDLNVSGCIRSYQCIKSITTNTNYQVADDDFGKILHYAPANGLNTKVELVPVGAGGAPANLADGWQVTVMNTSTASPVPEIEFWGNGVNLFSFGTKLTGQYQAASAYYMGGTWYAVGHLTV